MSAPIALRWLTADDEDLADIADALNRPDWEPSADRYTAEALEAFLRDERHLYLVASIGDEIAGAAHAYLMLHPGGALHLYIDEVDTRERFRRMGVATAMVNALIQMARDKGADDAWLGTEHDNEAANALYRSLGPDEVEAGPIYTFYASTHGSGGN